jgi:hypothetical protein
MASSRITNIITGLTILNKYTQVTDDTLSFPGDINIGIRHRDLTPEDREALVAANWRPSVDGVHEIEWEVMSYHDNTLSHLPASWGYLGE